MYTGLTGKLSVKENSSSVTTEKDICYISNWSVEETTDIIEFSQLGAAGADAGFKIKKPGQQSWSASADGAVSFLTAANQSDLFSYKANRTEIRVRFYLDCTKAGTETYLEGYGYIESLSVDLSAEDMGNISIGISGSSHAEGSENSKKEYGLKLYVNGKLQEEES